MKIATSDSPSTAIRYLPQMPAKRPQTSQPLDVPFDSKPLFILAVVWLFATTLLFYTSSLPNSADFESRFQFLLLWPEIAAIAFTLSDSSTLASVFERLPYWAIASIVVANAITWGLTILRRSGVSQSLDPVSQIGLAGGLGLSAVSLVTLALGLVGVLKAWVFWPLMTVPMLCQIGRHRLAIGTVIQSLRRWRPDRAEAILLALTAPFALAILMGASLPSVDFDVREYHLQGPKEFLLNGRISFLKHNVYTSFPFLTEMLSLNAMTLCGDWWGGAIAGKVVLASFAFFTALLLWSAGRAIDRWAGPLAVLVWVTSPWCYRASTIAYTEGALSYYVLAVLVFGHIAWKTSDTRLWGVVGLLAGSAMSCKYPGLVQAVVPAGLVVAWFTFAQEPSGAEPSPKRWSAFIYFVTGTSIAFGPWALKNLAETGNPVYPLGYSVFGGVDLDAAWATKWAGGHSPPFNVLTEPIRAIPDFVFAARDVFVKNDWQTPLVLCFAPLAFMTFFRERRAVLIAAGLFTLWLYVMWWALTHRIDRFWVPMLPVVCLLAGVGLRWPALLEHAELDKSWRWIGGGLVTLSLLYHAPFIAAGQAGYQQWLAPYDVARQQIANTSPSIELLNQLLPVNSRPLLVGEAQVFDMRVQPVYNTVFDDSIFQELTSADRTVPDVDQPTATKDEICARLTNAGVTHVFVNWSEVLRYRETYGYTDYVAPHRFRELEDRGVLRPIMINPQYTHVQWDDLNESTQQLIDTWGPEIHVQANGVEALRRFELFEVVCNR